MTRKKPPATPAGPQVAPHAANVIAMPASRTPRVLLSVDRAVSEIRRGRAVVLLGAEGRAVLVQAAEAVTQASLDEARARSGAEPRLAVTRTRARVLGLTPPPGLAVVRLVVPEPLDANTVMALANPLDDTPPAIEGLGMEPAAPHDPATAAVELAKIARLLPAATVTPLDLPDAEDPMRFAARADLLVVDAGDVFQYDRTAARTLSAVSEARVPLGLAENTRVIAFRPDDGGLEHLAIIIGEPNPEEPVLVRLHSECFTGDLLGSLRCDCGDQLKGAIGEIAAAGAGVLLYLAQEGRGIGLVNKLRAYQLPDGGFDTMDANEQLGFDADERIYLPAVEMLKRLGFAAIRLLTNNPLKVEALAACGLAVIERVPHSFPANAHNALYLQTKKAKGGHLF